VLLVGAMRNSRIVIELGGMAVVGSVHKAEDQYGRVHAVPVFCPPMPNGGLQRSHRTEEEFLHGEIEQRGRHRPLSRSWTYVP
jgi:hypothetical protein